MKKTKYQSGKKRPNKLLGQHFLSSDKIIEDMVVAAHISKNDTILEIGPGRGILTKALAKNAKKVIAIEKDFDLIEPLEALFKKNNNIKIIYGDILLQDYTKLVPEPYKVVANIPYYLTSHLFRKLLEQTHKPTSITLMVQYEIARRMTARPPHMNLLALSVQAFGDVNYIKKVSREYFKPRPRVDSAIVTITNIRDDFFINNSLDQTLFFQKLRKAFGNKRKMLRNTIGIMSQRRPQELSLSDWATILKST